ncbi:MAG: 23S rRNA (uracil(1939)-C(5))-methyltransferase RlmD [Firmicutes bacterium]|nr:23S rRNA (uracil(1939)-C(5))-methyltransferase RlmD [Bacillota bacterium]
MDIIRITDISSDGEGIGRTAEGMVVFVPGALPGDTIEAEVLLKEGSRSAKGVLLRIAEPSPDRIEPPCPYAAECGGCPLMGLSYKAQLALKQKHVEDALLRIGGFKAGEDYVLKDIIFAKDGAEATPQDIDADYPMPLRYRNKAEFAISGNRVGYLKRGTHSIVEPKDCVIQQQAAMDTVERVRAELKPTQKYFTRLVVRTSRAGEVMTIKEDRDGGFVSDRRILKDEIVTAAGTLKTEISPQSFYQVNSEGCSILYTKAQQYARLTGSESLLDLYCGAGSIGLSMAGQCARVIGVESVKPAVLDANRNAVINGIVNATFVCGRAEDVIDTKLQGVKADVVVLDPPRAGCAKSLLEAVLKIAPQRVVYVSCNPSTLARDLKVLCEDSGYRLVEATPVDMFPGTLHVETVCCLYHQKKDYISVPYEPKDAEYLK